ncbi:MAG TPA: alpha-amylase family glycosyl hydrolase [Bacillota bacterium]|nr:alpha-amylase family glycosyl hydrolase [Bacillota bacterium]
MATEVITGIDVERLERIYSLKTITKDYIHSGTPMGANLTHNGATFRVWAPNAKEVYVLVGEEMINDCRNNRNCQLNPSKQLMRLDDLGYGHWAGFLEDVKDGDQYQYYIVGEYNGGLKRDPFARELTKKPDLNTPRWNCIVRDPNSYPWQDGQFHTPAFHDLIIYEMHVGTIGPISPTQANRFLDVLFKLEHIRQLGVNAIELLPIVEVDSSRSMGYDNIDIFSPEMEFHVDVVDTELHEFQRYLDMANSLLQGAGKKPVSLDILKIPINQLKLLIDIFHAYGIAVIFDVVYNHIGINVPDQSHEEGMWMLDCKAPHDYDHRHDTPYFNTDKNHVGPCFGIKNPRGEKNNEVCQFLINNAKFFINEYHVDGFRYDQVTVITDDLQAWDFCQNLTDTIRYIKPSAIQIAEHWPWMRAVDPWVVKSSSEGGASFDSLWDDRLRDAVRRQIRNAAVGNHSDVYMTEIRDTLYPPNFPLAWKSVQHIENHDKVSHNDARIAALAGNNDPNFWYMRSRSRVASGILLTAPGIPMLFMGQEILESRQWDANPKSNPDKVVVWEESDPRKQAHKQEFFRFMRDLVWLRRKHPALRAQFFGEINCYHANNPDRILAYQRYLNGSGRDVVVVASLRETNFYEYWLGFPQAGYWKEVFNSNIYDLESDGLGNRGQIDANGSPRDGMPYSANIVIPANSIVVFARDLGDF